MKVDMQTIIADWKANAERHVDRNFAFLRSLKMKNERAVDRAARELHDEAFSSGSRDLPADVFAEHGVGAADKPVDDHHLSVMVTANPRYEDRGFSDSQQHCA